MCLIAFTHRWQKWELCLCVLGDFASQEANTRERDGRHAKRRRKSKNNTEKLTTILQWTIQTENKMRIEQKQKRNRNENDEAKRQTAIFNHFMFYTNSEAFMHTLWIVYGSTYLQLYRLQFYSTSSHTCTYNARMHLVDAMYRTITGSHCLSNIYS